jgi:hypothetical protein
MPKEVTFHITELIAAISFVLTFLGLTGVLAKKKGWITFGKPVERRSCPENVQKICQEHNQMIMDLGNVTRDIGALTVELKSATGALNAVKVQIERHMGYHAGADDEKSQNKRR